MSFLYKYWRKYRFLFVSSVFCVGMEAVCDLLNPQIMARLIDNGVNKLDMRYVLTRGLLMLLVTAIGMCFACARNVLSSRTSQKFGAEMRQDLFAKIGRLSIADAEIYEGGSLVTRMTNDVTQLTNFVNGIMRIFFKAPIVCIGSIVLAASINTRAVPIVAGILVVAVLSISTSMKLSYPVFARVQSAIDKMNTTIREYLAGIRLVKAFGRFAYEEERFSAANENLADISTRANRILGIFSPLNNLAANTGIAVIIILGARWVGEGDMQVGQIVAFISYMTQILGSLSMISNILNIFVRTKASYVRIADVMHMPDSESAKEGDMHWPKTPADALRFSHVHFHYPLATGDKALQDISFTLQKGETIGVIGPTGSGKSTLAALLLRFYDTTDGEIRFDDVPITDIPPHFLRRRIGFVPQTPMLFTGTIADNIRWANPDLSVEEMELAVNTAQAGEFIQNAVSGYNTLLGQGGINLSGGQKQRLSIARALAAAPDLLILDDCTSALDALTEAAVQKGLRENFSDLTCVLISQRISTVMRADKILVLHNGMQAGCGSHAALLRSCDVYRDIYASQMGADALRQAVAANAPAMNGGAAI